LFVKAKRGQYDNAGFVVPFCQLDVPYHAAIVLLVSIVLLSQIYLIKVARCEHFVIVAIFFTRMHQNDLEFGYINYAYVICQDSQMDT
jgi:hypothetical protein